MLGLGKSSGCQSAWQRVVRPLAGPACRPARPTQLQPMLISTPLSLAVLQRTQEEVLRRDRVIRSTSRAI